MNTNEFIDPFCQPLLFIVMLYLLAVLVIACTVNDEGTGQEKTSDKVKYNENVCAPTGLRGSARSWWNDPSMKEGKNQSPVTKDVTEEWSRLKEKK